MSKLTNRIARTAASPRTRQSLRLAWMLALLGAIALGVAAPNEYDIP